MASNPSGDDNKAGNPYVDVDGDVHVNASTIYLEDANIVFGATTGTKIGTATTDLIGFYNATPVDQPAVTADLLDSLQEVGLIASGAGDTPLNLTAGALTCGALTATGNVNLGNATTDLVGFHGSTATDQCAAYTQTYATAARTIPAEVVAIAGGESPTEAEHNLLVADVLALKKALNAIIDDLQEKGLVG